MDKDKLVEQNTDARDCLRLLSDVNYQLGTLAGRLDLLGARRAVKNVLAAHAQITKARAALRSRAQPK